MTMAYWSERSVIKDDDLSLITGFQAWKVVFICSAAGLIAFEILRGENAG
jgi:hypothetical protein